MKYDAGMVHFRDDVLAAIRIMLRSNTQITESFSKNDASPAPLRDYIKETYKHRGGAANGVRYQCAPSKGFETFLSRQVNNGGDHKLTLSWSQVAKFVRDNWDDIFAKDEDEDEENIPKIGSYVEEDMLGEELTFDEIADMVGEIIVYDHSTESRTWYKIVKIEAIFPGTDGKRRLRYYDGSKQRGTVSEIFFDKNHYRPQRAWRIKRGQSSDFPCDNCQHDENGCLDYPDTADNYCVCEDKQMSTFDYGTLDKDTAQSLKNCENVIRQQTADYFTTIGAQLKDAQMLLANHSNGTFEQWYTSLGFKRQTVYNLIQRFEFINSPTIGGREEAFEALPVTLSYEISKPDAPKELVEKVLDGDITTNAEYKKLKAELERTKDDLRNVERNFDEREKLRQKLDDENVQLKIKIMEQDKELKAVSEKDTEISSLRQRIEELENRPIDVAVQADEEALAEKDEEIAEKNEEIAELREQLEALQEQDKKYKPFLIKLTVEEWEELIGITEKHASRAISTAVKTAKIVRF